MTLLFRVLVLVVTMYLVLVVASAKHHDDARGMLVSGLRKLAKFLAWTAGLTAVMVLLELLFID